jgi:hypothetical protein
VAGIETQTDIAMCVPKTVAKGVVGRYGSILVSSLRSFHTRNNLNWNWIFVGLYSSWWFNFGEGLEETED